MTLKGQLEARIQTLERFYADKGYDASEQDALTDAEREVFDIDPARFARMASAWDCYAALLGLYSRGGYTEGALLDERKAQASIVAKGKDEDGFRAFAQHIAGVNYRECDAITALIHWRMIRAGHVGYHDELGDTDEE